MNRRQFAFWIGMFLFWVSEKAHAYFIDSAAAHIMSWSESQQAAKSRRERWRAKENRTWRWYERSALLDGKWKVTGITTPIHKTTGKPYKDQTGYLDTALVPKNVKESATALKKKLALAEADASRRAEGGRPPSKWLRSLHADEIRIWLKSIDVPPVGVDGMTFWTHLTRDHFFAADRIEGLTIPEQAKLHAAAHFGY